MPFMPPVPPHSPPRRAPIGLILAAFVVPLVFAFITDHVWEDFYITFRSSRNLAAGHGLVFQAGERVHAFTSPLGVLVPALFAWLSSSDNLVIWLFRIFSAGLLAATMAIWSGIASAYLRAPLARLTLFGMLLFDAKIVAFSTDGMETAMLLFFLSLAVRELLRAEPRRWAVAIAFGGLMWTRPDGFVFFGALLAGAVVFIAPRQSWRLSPSWIKALAVGIALGGLLYLPWFSWAWWYYGTPIPNTITAKSEWISTAGIIWRVLQYPFLLPFGITGNSILFEPIYTAFGGWPPELRIFSKTLATLAALYFIAPGAQREGRALSFALFVGGFYLQIAPASPWYYQVWQLLTIGALAFLVDDLMRFSEWLRGRWPVSATAYASGTRVAVLVMLLIQFGIFAGTVVQFRWHQRIVQDGVRKQVGLWLRDNAGTGDRVFLEPLGYVGYFSNLKMLDYPGLSAPEMAAELRKTKGDILRAIPAFWPEWLVLRPHEARQLAEDVMQHYQLTKVFDVRAQVDELTVPGRGYLAIDSTFLVYHRAGESPEPRVTPTP